MLLVGGGCRGLELARELIDEGHAVRVVTRSVQRRPAIEAIGAECWIGDPDRIGTLRYALDNVTILLWALGTASGDAGRVADLHGSRLAMMLERTVDTMVRGVVYEQAGSVDPAALERGVEEVRRANATNEVPFAVLEADPADTPGWVAAARAAIADLLAPRRATTAR
jgi:NAD(P)-dependent dehydrogenase (short-subunit alcohol dehydrogenase family)